MNWNNIKITIFKEIRGVFRDKKTIQKLILYPLIIPLVIFLFGFLLDGMTEADYVIGTNYKLTDDENIIIKEYKDISIKNYDNSGVLYLKKIDDKYNLYHIDINKPNDEDYYTYEYFLNYYNIPENTKIKFVEWGKKWESYFMIGIYYIHY